MLTALIAPEIVLYVAFTQYTQASELCRILNGPVSGEIGNDQVEEGSRASNETQSQPLIRVLRTHGWFRGRC